MVKELLADAGVVLQKSAPAAAVGDVGNKWGCAAACSLYAAPVLQVLQMSHRCRG